MSDDVQTSATIASLRASLEASKEREESLQAQMQYVRQALDERNAYAERLLAENVRLSNDAATARERAGVLEAEVRAWRYHLVQGETVGGDQDGADCRLNAAMADTDRTKALYANEFGGA